MWYNREAKIRDFAVLPLLLASSLAMAQPAPPPDGNLAAGLYIAANCQRPDPFTLPKPGYGNREDIASYNFAVRRHNTQLKVFDACINDYADKGSNDIDWIVFTANAAVAKANGTSQPSPPAALGNMPAGFYPAPDCITPDRKLGTQPDGFDAKAMNAYNTKVRTFNVLAAGYNDCDRSYVARARVDIEQIEQSRRDATAQAAGQQ